MSQSQSSKPPETFSTVGGNKGVSRRNFMRAAAAGAGVAAAGSVSMSYVPRRVAADVTAWDVVSFGAIDGIEWALREMGVIGADEPPDGLSADALENEAHNTTTTRRSTNASTFVDNRNIIDGVNHTAYTDAKIAAVEKLNEGVTQQEVTDAATEVIDEYISTVMTNLFRTWNESVREIRTLVTALNDHPDTVSYNVLVPLIDANVPDNDWRHFSLAENTSDYTLPNGDTFTVELLDYTFGHNAGFGNDTDESFGMSYAPHSPQSPQSDTFIEANMASDPDTEDFDYYPAIEIRSSGETYLWGATSDGTHTGTEISMGCAGVFSDLEDTYTQVSDGMTLWIDSLYSDVQSGSIEVEDVITPAMQAEMMSGEEDYPQVYADLMALNVPVNTERQARVSIPSRSATISGTLAVTDSSITLETGTEYDPDADIDGTVYMTYDVSASNGDWTEYEPGLDGGIVTFTSEPYGGTTYVVSTNSGEAAEVTAEDFTDQGDGTFTADLSDQLQNNIADVESVEFYPESTETRYETIQLSEPFLIESFTDSEGNEHETATFDHPTEPQSDNNYLTQEEFDQMQSDYEKLIEKYEEQQAAAGGGGGGFLPDFDLGANKVVVAAAALLAGYGLLSN